MLTWPTLLSNGNTGRTVFGFWFLVRQRLRPPLQLLLCALLHLGLSTNPPPTLATCNRRPLAPPPPLRAAAARRRVRAGWLHRRRARVPRRRGPPRRSHRHPPGVCAGQRRQQPRPGAGVPGPRLQPHPAAPAFRWGEVGGERGGCLRRGPCSVCDATAGDMYDAPPAPPLSPVCVQPRRRRRPPARRWARWGGARCGRAAPLRRCCRRWI